MSPMSEEVADQVDLCRLEHLDCPLEYLSCFLVVTVLELVVRRLPVAWEEPLVALPFAVAKLAVIGLHRKVSVVLSVTVDSSEVVGPP